MPASQIDNANRTYDLRNAVHGGVDGDWNWDPLNGGGSTGAWNELMRASRCNSWTFGETFDLALADNQAEVWVAFWLDNGESDIGKFDNVIVTGDQMVVPIPAAIWLFGSGLVGLFTTATYRRS